jgi:cellulose synthase/poly-beta-1,6-N-acetylglucosamine synthase-like glycosyltransferase
MKPNELIIMDAGSTDGTIDVIKKFEKKCKWIKLIIEKNVSRGKGRNLAIQKSKNDIIAVTDAGCILDRNWLKNISKFFNKGTDIIVGYYKPFYETDFQFFCGNILVHKNITETVRISSRSLAFKKIVWEKAGGYEETVDVGEDTLLHWKMIKNKFKMKFVKNAVVYWIMPKSSKEIFNKFFKYGNGYWKTIKLKEFRKFLIMIFGSYFYSALIIFSLLVGNFYLTGFLILLLFLGLFFVGIRGVLVTKKIKALLYLPYLFFLKNFAFVLGFTLGGLMEGSEK